MGAHEAPDAVLTHFEADHHRARALELVADYDTLPMPAQDNGAALIDWSARAWVTLRELARG